jgi:hypothetical protein
MPYKSKKSAMKEFGKLYVQGLKLGRKKVWQKAEFQTSTNYATNGMEVKEFTRQEEADKFAEKKEKEGYHTLTENEKASFYGAVCNRTNIPVVVVYYSKDKISLTPNQKVFVKSKNYSEKPICADFPLKNVM